MSKLVRESVSFERGGDPRKTMGVGRLERLKEKYGEEDLNQLLITAAEEGSLEDVKYLFQQDVDMSKYGNFAIMHAAEEGRLDVVKYLMENGAAVYGQDVWIDDYYTEFELVPLLLRVVYLGHLDIVKYLVEQGANIDAEDNEALRLANEKGHQDIAEYLKSQM